ncbi:hypothetical protein EAO76_13125, partial [Streptomyces sp. sk2.1]
ANVVGEPDPYLGERTCAYVILRAGAEPLKPVAVKRFVRERGLAAYKVPVSAWAAARRSFLEILPTPVCGNAVTNSTRSGTL